MISETIIRNSLRREHIKWRRELKTEFIAGIMKGLEISILLVQETGREAKNVREVYKGRLNRWSAARFYQAIQTSLASLKGGQKTRAVSILEKAIKVTEEGK